MDSEDLLEVVDERNRVVGVATRGEVHSENLMHRSAHVFLFDFEGRLFIQKRSESKDRFPLHYDSSAAGHLDAGESYPGCAIRELLEELGIEGVPLTEAAHFKACEETGWEHTSLYLCRTDDEIRINRDEIAEGGFYTLEETEAMIEKDPPAFTSAFRLIFRWLIHNKGAFEGMIKGVR